MTAGARQDAEPVRRTPEIEDITNLLFVHPVAARLVPVLAALHVPPNAVSLVGLAGGVAAGFAYHANRDWYWAVAGLLLMICWHIMDGADGQLARLPHSQSASGKVLDGICDYVTFVAVYVGLALVLSRSEGTWVWLLIAVSGACHALQSAAYEAQREVYVRWSRALAAGHVPAKEASLKMSRPAAAHGVLGGLYERVQAVTAGAGDRFGDALAAILAARPGAIPTVRQRYKAVFAPAVRRWSILCANYRTLGIFLCTILKKPLVFFWFEIFGFSTILAVLLYRQRARYRTFLVDLAAQAPPPAAGVLNR